MDRNTDDGRRQKNPHASAGSFATAPRRRRRFSVWTILAPAAVIVLFVAFFSALGQSCIFKECAKSKSSDSSTADSADKRNSVPRGGRSKVKAGDSLGSIAARYELTEEELKACNPKVDPQSLQPGQYLRVAAIDCEDADRAAVGANPDPLAGDTSAAGAAKTPAPEANGTAAADPSANPPADAAADQGDEG
ncbi:MAG: LysM domain [Thermoleophilia bacterium]|nr:LysM domain [Thermoleophilia bacterium]